MNDSEQNEYWYVKYIIIFFFAMLIIMPFFFKLIKPWMAQQDGKAELAQAEQNRQIKIIEAEAANTAATSQAEAQVKIATAQATAEIERAKGVAEANRIIGESLADNDEYLRYLWIQELGDKSVIYVPTEGNLPIMEAGKR